MNRPEHIELMHSVLDGEATPAQEQELNRLLATDRLASRRFEELRRLFGILGRVPAADPPEDLVDLVMAKVRLRQTQPDSRRQPFAHSGVIAAESVAARNPSPGILAGVRRLSR